MSDPETSYQPLIGAPSQQTGINVGAPPQGGRNTRAYKVAGLTLLACVLIVGQAMVAYFLLSQKNDLKSLQEQNDNMRAEMTRGRSVSVPVRMHLPMNALPELTVDPMDEEASAGTPEKAVPMQGTKCQMEAAGVKPVQVPGFLPKCDERGLYRAQQCYMGQCWCADPVNGNQIPGSLGNGPGRCRAAVPAGVMSNTLALSEDDA
uniref:Thyroglobulin type-1 domain-containing protein n=1 Tax=Monopterus albus TaxID=43700 RepID=A0A3Q3Q198_MONAL|nr:uncharacterized protein LOC109959360 [Monopterus albus]XP_020454308.1 uncharacterized protein LOC109959360 [Monopterus albus]XP_020454316.1 uncharacterized protein LOC109959360 [Monopterus albus]XP_020454324.1 uncharacterized protein LOC109959360 [Monopterus albus]XP_020454331.1 uncharacterized protein LOC109959360 [Monopterus albus]